MQSRGVGKVVRETRRRGRREGGERTEIGIRRNMEKKWKRGMVREEREEIETEKQRLKRERMHRETVRMNNACSQFSPSPWKHLSGSISHFLLRSGFNGPLSPPDQPSPASGMLPSVFQSQQYAMWTTWVICVESIHWSAGSCPSPSSFHTSHTRYVHPWATTSL